MTYAEIEGAVIDALRGNVPVLRLVEPYAGQLEEEVEKLAMRFPSAYVVHGGSEFSWVDGSSYREQLDFSVLVVQRAARGSTSIGHGPVDRSVLEAVLEALAHLSPGGQAERLVPLSYSLLFTNRLITVHALEFRCAFDRSFKD